MLQPAIALVLGRFDADGNGLIQNFMVQIWIIRRSPDPHFLESQRACLWSLKLGLVKLLTLVVSFYHELLG